jgi:two-component system CheB/CheR fusion protein
MSTKADERERRAPRMVVGIGASAGGLDACRKLLDAMPTDSGMALVVVMHVDPTRESRIAEIFRTNTTMPVVQVVEAQPLARDHVYVIAPDSALELRDGVLHPTQPDDPRGHRKPIDTFFASLAQDQGERAVAIVLSGTGNNGSLGLREVKMVGGLCLAQDPETAQYDGMPRAAIATDMVDHIVAPGMMPKILLDHLEHPRLAEERGPHADDLLGPFDAILELLGRTYGVNFRGSYKRGTLERRTERRMGQKRLGDWNAYLDVLRHDPGEVAVLYRELLVDVTQFFRDPEVWARLEVEVIPALFAEHGDDELPLKVWVPGCATGEEAYSHVIVLLEQRERLGRHTKVQIFATDVAEDALATARRGRYSSGIQEHVSPARLARFFRKEGERYEVTREVRDAVTFARHNLLADPPFSGLSLVSCRNVLIYLEAHSQHRVLQLFHFALEPGGVLLLGASETVGRHGDLFETISTTARVYRPTAITKAARYPVLRRGSEPAGLLGSSRLGIVGPRGPKVSRVIEQIVLSRFTWACVAVTESFEIRSFFGPTQDYLVQPVGEARLDLLAWAKPGLYPRLRSALERAADRKERVTVGDLWMERDGKSFRVECTIEPITPLPGEARLYLVVFRDIPISPAETSTATGAADEPLVRQLEAELKAAREELQSTIEQLQTSNEEYRASHEELLSLNEELQSNNEELQASKQELLSLNEEMVTINRQLEDKNSQLRTVNTDITNLLVSTDIPIIFLDRELCVRRFTPAATELMRLIPSDVGRSVEHIKERFHDGGLLADARRVLDKLIPITTEVQTEDGRWYARKVLPYRTEDDHIDGVCIAFHDITASRKAADDLHEARIYAEAIVETTRTALVVLDRSLRVVSANTCFYDVFRLGKAAVVGAAFYELGNRQWDTQPLRAALDQLLREEQELKGLELELEAGPLGRRVMRLNARLLQWGAHPPLLLLAIEDVTERKTAQALIEARADELAREHRRKNEFLAMLAHELRNPLAPIRNATHLLEHEALSERGRRALAMSRRQLVHLARLVDDLLEVARVNARLIDLRPEPLVLQHVLRGVVDGLAPVIDERSSTAARARGAASGRCGCSPIRCVSRRCWRT